VFFNFVLPQIFPGSKDLAAFFTGVSNMSGGISRVVLLLDGVVSNKPL
jgi:hypothetical protein